jgi:hypothetical protein
MGTWRIPTASMALLFSIIDAVSRPVERPGTCSIAAIAGFVVSLVVLAVWMGVIILGIHEFDPPSS